jgi:hypothetical protein
MEMILGDIVVFDYQDPQWTTGDLTLNGFVSRGADRLDAGDGTHFYSYGRPSSLPSWPRSQTRDAFRLTADGVAETEPSWRG